MNTGNHKLVFDKRGKESDKKPIISDKLSPNNYFNEVKEKNSKTDIN